MENIKVCKVTELPETVKAEVMACERRETGYTEYCEGIAWNSFVEYCEEHGIDFVNKDEVSRWDYRNFVTDDEEINKDPFAFVEFKFFQPAHESDEHLTVYLNEYYVFTETGQRIDKES